MKRKLKAVVLGLCVAMFLIGSVGCSKGKIRICTRTKEGDCKCREWGKGDACEPQQQCGGDDCGCK